MNTEVTLTIAEQSLIDRYIRRFRLANKKIGLTPSDDEMERAKQEATVMVMKGQITEADFRPQRFEIQEFRSYSQYQEPTDKSISA